MSIREHITNNIINTLKNADTPRFGLVSRDMIALDKLSRQQFPAIYIETSNEVRRNITMAGPFTGLRDATLSIRIIGWVSGAELDRQRNELISNVENTLHIDITRDGFALNTQLTEIRSDFIEDTYAKVEMIVEVYYKYQQGKS
jgi:hypothetical protein